MNLPLWFEVSIPLFIAVFAVAQCYVVLALRGMNSRVDSIDRRFGSIGSIDKRFDSIDRRLDSADDRFRELRAEMKSECTALSSKVDILYADLSTKIDTLNKDLSTKIDTLNKDISGKLETLNQNHIDHLSAHITMQRGN